MLAINWSKLSRGFDPLCPLVVCWVVVTCVWIEHQIHINLEIRDKCRCGVSASAGTGELQFQELGLWKQWENPSLINTVTKKETRREYTSHTKFPRTFCGCLPSAFLWAYLLGNALLEKLDGVNFEMSQIELIVMSQNTTSLVFMKYLSWYSGRRDLDSRNESILHNWLAAWLYGSHWLSKPVSSFVIHGL